MSFGTATESKVRRVWRGATAIFAGMAHVWRDKGVQRTYRYVLLVLFAFALLLNGAGIYAVLKFTSTEPESSTWIRLGFMLLRGFGVLVVLLLSPIVALTTCNLLFPAFSEVPFFAGLRSFDRERGRKLQAQPGLGNAAAISNSLRRFGILLVKTLACFLLGLVPVIGTFAAPPLSLYLAAKMVGWEMLDPYFDRLGIEWSDQKLVTKRFGPEILGMGLVCAPLLSIPLLGPLLFGLLQASAAHFVTSVLPPSDDPRDLIPSRT